MIRKLKKHKLYIIAAFELNSLSSGSNNNGALLSLSLTPSPPLSLYLSTFILSYTLSLTFFLSSSPSSFVSSTLSLSPSLPLLGSLCVALSSYLPPPPRFPYLPLAYLFAVFLSASLPLAFVPFSLLEYFSNIKDGYNNSLNSARYGWKFQS